MSDLAAIAPQFIDQARTALEKIAPVGTVGGFHGVEAFDPDVVFMQFSNTDEAYQGWMWTAALGRSDETSEPTVLETELLPGDHALLAPKWVSWAERIAEYQAEHTQADTEDEDADSSAGDSSDEAASDVADAKIGSADDGDGSDAEDDDASDTDVEAVGGTQE